MTKYENPFKVVIVDDSSVVLSIFERTINKEPDMVVTAMADDGIKAIETMQEQQDADIVTLDIEMPNMDGITALPELLKIAPNIPIVIASTLTQRNADTSLKALSLGARDYIAKPSAQGEVLVSAEEFQKELVQKIRIWATKCRKARGLPMPTPPAEATQNIKKTPSANTELQAAIQEFQTTTHSGSKPQILAIGSSTGGPQALFQFFKDLEQNIDIPVVITQHMPATFTPILCEHIERQSGWKAKEGKQGDRLEKNTIYMAPGDYHMLIEGTAEAPSIKLTQTDPVNFCRPAVDPMLESLIDIYGANILTVILTGMGKDGLEGCRLVKKSGGNIIAQDEETSIVWGMPGAVATDGICSHVLPLEEIGTKVTTLLTGEVS